MSSSRAKVLRKYFHRPRDDPQPILTSLNGDNSWLISIPVPEGALEPSSKAFYHIVTDPWLQGPAIQFHSWLVHINLATPAVITSGSVVEDVVREIEDAAANHWGRKGGAAIASAAPTVGAPMVDAIFCTFHATDHTHSATLKTFNPDIPLFGPSNVTSVVKGLSHFKTVITTKDCQDRDWKSKHPGSPLPSWLSTFRLNVDHIILYGMVIVWSSGANLDKHQALVYSPHGVNVQHQSLQTFCHNLAPDVSVVAILHPLADTYAFGIRTSSRVMGGIALCEELKPKYWIKSEAPLTSQGLILKVVRDFERTLESGIEELRRLRGDKGLKEGFEKVEYVEVGNGESFALA